MRIQRPRKTCQVVERMPKSGKQECAMRNNTVRCSGYQSKIIYLPMPCTWGSKTFQTEKTESWYPATIHEGPVGRTRGCISHIQYYCVGKKIFLNNPEKNGPLQQLHAESVKVLSKTDREDKEDYRVRDMFTAHMLNEKTSENLLAETRTLKEAYDYAIRHKISINKRFKTRAMYTTVHQGAKLQ